MGIGEVKSSEPSLSEEKESTDVPSDLSQHPDLLEHPERLAAIVDSSDDAIISKDLNGIIRSWNRGAERIFGYTADEIIGQPITTLAVPGRLEEMPHILEKIRRGERIDHYETQRKAKDGRVLSVSLTVSPIRNEAGVIVGASKVARDITRQKRAAEVQEQLAAIVESSDDAIISKDLNGIIRSWNRAAERIFGYTADEMVGRPISTLAVPGRLEEFPDILERIRRGERIEHYETRRRTKDGRILAVSLSVSPIRDAAGIIIGAAKIARDITDRVRAEEAMRKMNAALVRANDDLEQFAYSASHDLREPLRMVATYSQLLQRKFHDQLGPEGEKYIRYTVEGAHRMERLLVDLLAYTQAATQSGEVREETDACEALRRALANLQASINGSDASITYTPLPGIRMHPFQVEQIFQNLIGNAIRYRGAEPPKIQICSSRQGDNWLFSVRDNGIGIEPQYKEQIFGMFKRLHTRVDYPGSGMGLAICQRIIHRVGGRIWVESEPGSGSTFFFTVPVEPLPDPALSR